MASNGRGLRTSAFRINEKVADHVKGLISQKYEAEYKGEDLQRKVRKCMQQGLADKAMDFTPGKWFMG